MAGSSSVGDGQPGRTRQGELFVDHDSVGRNLKIAMRLVPQLASAQVVRTWPAVVNGTADWRPILGEVPSVPGFFVCIFPWMGFTGLPAAAQLVAGQLLGRRPPRSFAQFLPVEYGYM